MWSLLPPNASDPYLGAPTVHQLTLSWTHLEDGVSFQKLPPLKETDHTDAIWHLELPARVVRNLEIMTHEEWTNGLGMLDLEGHSDGSRRVSEQKRTTELPCYDSCGERPKGRTTHSRSSVW